jgi:hypothetical protein
MIAVAMLSKCRLLKLKVAAARALTDMDTRVMDILVMVTPAAVTQAMDTGTQVQDMGMATLGATEIATANTQVTAIV